MFDNYFHVAYDGDGNSEAQYNFEGPIACYSLYRGWGGYKNGSIVWADIREYGKPEYDNVVFICGHTQLEEDPIIMDWVADLDVRKPFVLDTETGEINVWKPS